MDVLPKPIVFDWDEGNIDKNWAKHKVSNEEAEDALVSKPLIHEDARHSKHEKRYQALGETNHQRKLFVSFTIRGGRIRVISSRDMNRKERSVYEKET